MNDFLSRFGEDPDFGDERRVWRTQKPLFLHGVVAYAPFSPEYPKLKVSKRRGPSEDPSCPSAKEPGDTLQVVLYPEGDPTGEAQARAWEFLQANGEAIEAALRRKLFAIHRKALTQLVEEELPDATHLRKYWAAIETAVDVREPSAIDSFFKLVGIGLAGVGLDECGFCSFEFQNGWDRDHGLGILMHRDKVLAAGAMGELIGRGISIEDNVRATQAYELDDGDFRLE